MQLAQPGLGARVRPTMALPSYLAKKRRNKLIILSLLILLLLLVGFFFARLYFARETPVPLVEEAKGPAAITPPSFLFAITGGPGDLALYKPMDVAVDPAGNRIYVTSFVPGIQTGAGRIEVFDRQGNYLFAFGEMKYGETLRAPISIATNKDGSRIYVVDKNLWGVLVFSRDGKFISRFVPNNDPAFPWIPLAVALDNQDNLFVSDIYSAHQIFVFDRAGKLKFKFGDIGVAKKEGEKAGFFWYPSAISVDDGKIFIADSNNSRIQVFDKKGKFLYMINSGGLPRGIAVDKQDYLYVVDALGHDLSIFNKKSATSDALISVGGQGVEYGQFLYPNGMAVGADRRIYIADRESNRVQVWGWPAVAAVPAPIRRAIPIIVFLLPFILYFLWRAIRRRRHLASQDFVTKVIDGNQLNKTKDKLKKVFVSPNTYEALKGYKEYDLEIERLIKPIKVEEAQVKNFQKTHEVSEETATLLVRAQRGLVKPRLFSETAEVHTTAQKLNVESMDHPLFMEYYHIK